MGEATMTPAVRVTVTDPAGMPRRREPIFFTVAAELVGDLWEAEADDGSILICQRLASRSTIGTTTFVTTADLDGKFSFVLRRAIDNAQDGIADLPAIEADAHVRLDTGYFDLELCRGTAEGTGASKWGLRHFAAHWERIDLLPSGNNAIGGFYGPFFTPENGLINPPEHVVAKIEEVEIGPVLHHYRLSGSVPDGLLEELRGKRFSIDWVFTHGTPFFTRRYNVDPFETVINGRFVENKITVGDEFESGIGDIVFNRFEAYDGTRYRAGDPYAEQLADMVDEILADPRERPAKFEEFRRLLSGDMAEAHWDLYWRLLSVWEGVVNESEIRERLTAVRAASHRLADGSRRPWIISTDPVNVSSAPEQTIFPGAASKTVEFDDERNRAMIWWTSKPAGAFQIVQRPESGWVNWGSNGENECPELPVGVEIKTAYGPFVDSWREIADGLEMPPTVEVDLLAP